MRIVISIRQVSSDAATLYVAPPAAAVATIDAIAYRQLAD